MKQNKKSWKHKRTGEVYVQEFPENYILTLSPKLLRMLENGVVFARKPGEKGLVIITKDELDNELVPLLR